MGLFELSSMKNKSSLRNLSTQEKILQRMFDHVAIALKVLAISDNHN